MAMSHRREVEPTNAFEIQTNSSQLTLNCRNDSKKNPKQAGYKNHRALSQQIVDKNSSKKQSLSVNEIDDDCKSVTFSDISKASKMSRRR
jgi:hypothetical protein